MKTCERFQRETEKAAWELPPHLISLVRKEAVDRRCRPAHVVARILAANYNVPIEHNVPHNKP